MESMIAFRIYLALRIFPVVEKIFAVLTFSIGMYFIVKATVANKIKCYKDSSDSCKSKNASIKKNYLQKENQISSLNDEANQQFTILLPNDGQEIDKYNSS